MATGDEVQFNAGIAALPAAGGKLLASAGNFNLATHILFNKNYIDFSGAGYGAEHIGAGSGIEGQGGTTLVTSVASIAAIRFAEPTAGLNASGCTLHDFGIFGNSGVVATTYGIVLDNVWSLALDRIRIMNCGSVGIYASPGCDVDQVYFNKVYVGGSGVHQWWIRDGGQYYLNQCYAIAAAGATRGFFFEDIDGLKATDCTADHCQYGYVLQATNVDIDGLHLVGCDSYGATQSNVLVYVTVARIATGIHITEFTGKDAYNGFEVTVYGTLRDLEILGGRSHGNTKGLHLIGDGYVGDSTYPGIDLSHHTFLGCTTPYDVTTDWTGSLKNSIIEDNQGYIHSGELRTASGALTAGNANAFTIAWQNPEAQAIWAQLMVELTTAGGTAGALLDAGSGASATTASDNLIDGADLNATNLLVSSAWVKLDANGGATDWITGQILVANAASLVGRFYVKYMGV
jgi:hypothetical protein